MRFLPLIILLTAFDVHAQQYGYPYTGQYNPYRIDTYQPRLRPQTPVITDSMPNIWGGEDFYGPSGFVGETQRNIHGGRDFYWSPTLQY